MVDAATRLYGPRAGTAQGSGPALVCAGSQGLLSRTGNNNEREEEGRCLHVLVVAASVWAATGREGSKDGEAEAQASREGDRLDQGESRPDGLDTAHAPVRGLTSRTAEHTLGRNPEDYTERLRNTPSSNVGIYKFPPKLPSSLPTVPHGESKGDVLEFTTWEHSWASCEDPFSSRGRGVEGKSVATVSRYFGLSSKNGG